MARTTQTKLRDLRYVTELFKAAAHPPRIIILLPLEEEERIAGSFSSEWPGLTRKGTSLNLTRLRVARLIERRRAGLTAIYSLTDAGRVLVRGIKAL